MCQWPWRLGGPERAVCGQYASGAGALPRSAGGKAFGHREAGEWRPADAAALGAGRGEAAAQPAGPGARGKGVAALGGGEEAPETLRGGGERR